MFELAAVPTGVWTAVSAVLILLLTKGLESALKRGTEHRLDRKGYREEIKDLQDRKDELENQVTLWRDRYYAEQTRAEGFRVQLVRNGVAPVEIASPTAPVPVPTDPA